MLLKKFIQRSFCVTEGYTRHLNNMSSRIKSKKTVGDVRKLKGFIEEANMDGSLKGKINRTARMDDKFSTWLKHYNHKNQHYPEILDLTRFADASTDLKKNASLRRDEIEMLHEFQKRKFDKMAAETQDGLPEEAKSDPNMVPSEFQNAEFFTRDRFITLIIARNTSTQVTTLSRINRCSYFLYCGNLQGVVGYGFGKGADWEVAMEKAVNNLKKNLVTIDLDYHYSWTDVQKTKFQRTFLTIEPNKEYKSWGDPMLGTMLHLAGIHHCRFHQFARNMNPVARLYAFMKAITQNRTPKIIAETEGKKLYEIGVSKKTKGYANADYFSR